MTDALATNEVNLHHDEVDHGKFHVPTDYKIPLNQYSKSHHQCNIGTPFNVETTLTFDAVRYWAKVDPDRTALVFADRQWKVDHGNLAEPVSHHSTSNPDSTTSESLVNDPSQWKTIT